MAIVLLCNGYPSVFIHAPSTPPTRPAEDAQREQPEGRDRSPLVVLPYMFGVSEDIRRVCGRYILRVVFRSGRTLHLMLTRVKDTLPLEKYSNVVYWISCGGCSKVYNGETTRRLETRLKEHQEALRRRITEKSAVAEHAWDNQHSIKKTPCKISCNVISLGILVVITYTLHMHAAITRGGDVYM